MARKAGQITIDLNAGTAKFLVDMDKANAKIREFGKHGVSESKAVNAGMKALEGGLLKNSKAAEGFFETVLKGAPIMAAAFPVIGGIAFAGMVVETGNKVREFFKEMKESPEKVSAAFREMAAPVRQANDDLAVANARLQQDINKLEGKRENTLQIMLLEAKSAADKLADSLERDLVNLDRVLKENDGGVWSRLFGKAKTSDIRELIGGESGYGGLRGSVSAVTGQFSERFAGAGSEQERDAIQRELDERLKRLYQDKLDEVKKKLSAGPGVSITGSIGKALTGNLNPVSFEDDRARVEELQAVARVLQEEMTRLALSTQNTQLTGKKRKLEADEANSGLMRPFNERIQALEAALEGARAKMENAGMGPAAKALTDSYAESLKVIADVNKALDQHHQKLTVDQEAQVRSLMGTAALTGMEAQWKERLEATTAQIRDQVRSQELLTAAIGQGAAAERQARIETRVMAAVGPEHYGDPAWMQAHGGDVGRVRSGIAADVDAQRRQQSAASVYSLEQELRLQQALTAAQREGEEAIRRITAMEIWRSGIERGLTGQQIVAEISLYYAKLRTQTAGGVARIEAETTATERLAAAQFLGAEAVRKAGLENKYAEMQRTGRGGEVAAERAADDAGHQAEITARVAARVNLYRDEGEKLDQELLRLREILRTHGATVDQARALRDLQRDRLRLWVQEQLAIGTARAGVRAFFAEMQAGSKRASNVVYDNLMSAVDRVSDELAHLVTGQQTNFGQMLRDMGNQAVRDSIKLGLEKGLGSIGKALGIAVPEAKPDGTKAKPFHVIVDNESGKGSDAGGFGGLVAGEAAGPAVGGFLKSVGSGLLGFLGKVFGGGATESVSSSISYRAAGGPVSPSEAYIVGESGPELLRGASGSITSNAEMRRTFGGGGDQYQISVDARGAELGVERRVYRAIEAAHRASVSNSVRATHERSLRTPQRAG